MKAGIKLYQEFKDRISSLGEIEIAWFTTFNLNLDFFEQYVLTALVGIDPKELRNANDFESLNAKLTGAGGDAKMDVKIFHDFRALDYREAKRTCVQVIGVDPNDLSSKCNGGVFHPKVALLVGKNGKSLLIAGSANMTYSGWGRNSEGVVFKDLNDEANSEQVFSFFWGLSADKIMKRTLRRLRKRWVENALKKSDNWYFQHSLTGDSLLDCIYSKRGPLTVWSPYFSNDLSEIIQTELKHYERVNIIPDFTEKDTIRVSDDVAQEIKNLEKVKVWKDLRDFDADTSLLVHAKVWLTNERLGIGSWNFTYAGMNLKKRKGSNIMNIEAGIVLDISRRTSEEIFETFPKADYSDDFLSQSISELEDEWGGGLHEWKTNIRVFLDWDELQFRVENVPEGFSGTVLLPGMVKPCSVENEEIIELGPEPQRLLMDRVFTVFDDDKNQIQVGLVVEENSELRPAYGFDNMADLISAWSSDKPESSPYVKVTVPIDVETGEEILEERQALISGDYTNAWFPMFLAMHNMGTRIKHSKENQSALRILGHQIPGSLKQLSEKLKNAVIDSKSPESNMSTVYLWFLVNEANANIRMYNKLVSRRELRVSVIKNLKLDVRGGHGAEASAAWIKHVRKSCGYAKT